MVEDGDTVSIDIPNRSIRLEIDEDGIEARLSRWKPTEKKIPDGYLKLYSKFATSAADGAILKVE